MAKGRPGRILIGAAVAAATLLAGAHAALAQSADPSLYAGSHITTPTSTDSQSPSITAEWIRRYSNGESFVVKTWFTTPGGLPSGCPGGGEVQLTTATGKGQKVNSTISAATAQTPCNGVYSFRLRGTLTNPIFGSDGGYDMNGQITVAAPPPALSKLNSELTAGTVTLSWAAVSDPPPDFKGYRVERLDSGGRYILLATLDPDQRSFTDSTPPEAGGDVVYRVLTRRAGPGDDEILSESAPRATVDLPPATTTTTPGTDGGVDGGTTGTTVPGGGDGGTGGGATGGGTAGPGGATGGATGGTGGGIGGSTGAPLDRGKVGAGTNAPRLGNPSTFNYDQLADPADPGYQDQLPYESTGGDALADGGEDGLSSAFYEEGAPKGMAVPVATGFVLAAWAFHLRFLARAAKPQRAPSRRGRHAL